MMFLAIATTLLVIGVALYAEVGASSHSRNGVVLPIDNAIVISTIIMISLLLSCRRINYTSHRRTQVSFTLGVKSKRPASHRRVVAPIKLPIHLFKTSPLPLLHTNLPTTRTSTGNKLLYSLPISTFSIWPFLLLLSFLAFISLVATGID